MVFFHRILLNIVTHLFAAWVILDMLISTELETVGHEDLHESYDFIIGNVDNLFLNLNI